MTATDTPAAGPGPQPGKGNTGRIAVLIVLAGALGVLGWWLLQPPRLEEGLASGNGRIEAVEIDVAAKAPGRLAEILVNEGDFVTRGQIVARMDTQVLTAQHTEAAAELRKADSGIQIAESQVAQRQSERVAAVAVVAQRRAELSAAAKRLARTKTLAREGAASMQEYDDDLAGQESRVAGAGTAVAQLGAAEAAIVTARAQVAGARASADAVRAALARIDADIDDSALKSPRDARVQFRVAQPSEVIAAGGKVLNLVDLTDVYMTFFLPNAAAGKISFGSEVRLVLDAAPHWVVPAHASYVADVAQFTPKTVETGSEREKLMFRVRARIDPAVLAGMIREVKTGLPGVAYVRVDPAAAWPERLLIRTGK